MDISQLTVQELNLELIKRAGFNDFDGIRVATDLESHSSWWKAAIMDGETWSGINLIKLRDITDNFWNVDTLFILVNSGYEQEIRDLADAWSADEVGWVESPDLGDSGQEFSVLRVWWD